MKEMGMVILLGPERLMPTPLLCGIWAGNKSAFGAPILRVHSGGDQRWGNLDHKSSKAENVKFPALSLACLLTGLTACLLV